MTSKDKRKNIKVSEETIEKINSLKQLTEEKSQEGTINILLQFVEKNSKRFHTELLDLKKKVVLEVIDPNPKFFQKLRDFVKGNITLSSKKMDEN
jgi:hypothetical protein